MNPKCCVWSRGEAEEVFYWNDLIRERKNLSGFAGAAAG